MPHWEESLGHETSPSSHQWHRRYVLSYLIVSSTISLLLGMYIQLDTLHFHFIKIRQGLLSKHSVLFVRYMQSSQPTK